MLLSMFIAISIDPQSQYLILHCSKRFRCVESAVVDLCDAKDIGLEGYVQCLDMNFASCPFVLSMGETHYCRCPIRLQIVKEFKK